MCCNRWLEVANCLWDIVSANSKHWTESLGSVSAWLVNILGFLLTTLYQLSSCPKSKSEYSNPQNSGWLLLFSIQSMVKTVRNNSVDIFSFYFLSFTLQNIPFLEFFHMQEPVPVLSGQFKLGRQWEHWFIEISQHSFHCGSVLMTVVDVIIQTDELPFGEIKENNTVQQQGWQRCKLWLHHIKVKQWKSICF